MEQYQLTIQNIAALETAIFAGTISPEDVVTYKEEDAGVWQLKMQCS